MTFGFIKSTGKIMNSSQVRENHVYWETHYLMFRWLSYSKILWSETEIWMCGHYRQTEIGLIKAKKVLVRSVSPCVLCAGTGSISRGKLAAPQFCILHVRSPPNIVWFGGQVDGNSSMLQGFSLQRWKSVVIPYFMDIRVFHMWHFAKTKNSQPST